MLRLLFILIAVLIGGCDSGKERMTAPPTESRDTWLLPPATATRVEPPVGVSDDTIASEGAIDIAVEGQQTNTMIVSQGGAAEGTTKGQNVFHVCRAAESVASIARKYSIDPDTLAKLNGTTQSSSPAVGSLLLLPRNLDNVSVAPDVKTYKVAQGDSYYNLARRLKLSSTALMALNKAKGTNLAIGDVLYVPNAR